MQPFTKILNNFAEGGDAEPKSVVGWNALLYGLRQTDGSMVAADRIHSVVRPKSNHMQKETYSSINSNMLLKKF